jgi:hypothetical protein
MRVSSVGQGIDVTNGDALAEEVDAAADVRALEISQAGGGGGDRSQDGCSRMPSSIPTEAGTALLKK